MSQTSIARAQLALSVGLADYGRHVFASERLSDMYSFVLRRTGAHSTYSRLTDRIEHLVKLTEQTTVQLAARRTLAVGAVSTLFVVLFGLPAISQSVLLLDRLSPHASTVLTAAGGTQLVTLWAYLSVVVATALSAAAFGFASAGLGRPVGRRRDGYTWGEPLRVHAQHGLRGDDPPDGGAPR